MDSVKDGPNCKITQLCKWIREGNFLNIEPPNKISGTHNASKAKLFFTNNDHAYSFDLLSLGFSSSLVFPVRDIGGRVTRKDNKSKTTFIVLSQHQCSTQKFLGTKTGTKSSIFIVSR